MVSSAYATLSPPVISTPSIIPSPRSLSAFVWSQFVSLARSTISAALDHGIRVGQVEISDSTGTTTFGPQNCLKSARHGFIEIKDNTFWVRIFLWYDIGFSEAFMNGEFTSPNLKEILNIYVDNYPYLDGLSTPLYKFNAFVEVVTQRFSHGFQKAVENVAGYDASNDLYRAFLSTEMQYSCPIWGDEEGGVRGDLEGHRFKGDLESAQSRKIRYILRKLRLCPGDKLLEIGSGWGSVAIAAAKMGCSVDTLTLSMEQKILAEERVKEAGVDAQVRVHLMDYRNMPREFEKSFDGCVSIEMLEAVGTEWMPTYFKTIDWALKDDRAAVVLTATTYPEATHGTFQGNDFVRKYHWPNCNVPSITSITMELKNALKGRFCVDSIEDFGIHYPRCLREWSRRFEENWTDDLTRSLQSKYPELEKAENLNIFKRKWQYMYVYMEVAYSRVWLSCPTWTFVRPGHAAELCA